MKTKEIRGKKVILRERRSEDAAFFAHWYNQPKVMFQCGFTEPTTEEKERATIARVDEDSIWYTVTIRLMIDLAFHTYDMNRIAIGVVGQNTNALEFYKKIGFKQEGIQEQGYYYNNEYSDFIMMRILKSEWNYPCLL